MTFGVILIVRAGIEIEKILVAPFGKQLEKIIIVARCIFLVPSLYNVNHAAHSMALSIKFDVWKYSRQNLVYFWKLTGFVYAIRHMKCLF